MITEQENTTGYASEVLKMLESEEGQADAVFLFFGSAAQHAQLFEQGLKRFLNVYNKICSDSVTIEDLEASSNLNKKTMGQLLKQLSKHVRSDDDSVSERFSTALKKRNYLMHKFFLVRNSDFKTLEGRMRMLAELTSIEQILDSSRITINAMRIAMCRTLKIEE